MIRRAASSIGGKRRRDSARALLAALALTLAACATAPRNGPVAHDAALDTFTNPLLPSGPDPWVTQQDGVYYYTNTLGNRIALWRTTDITNLVHAEKRTVWTPPATGPNARSIWAPELHRLNGKWYIYYSATASGFDDDRHRGVFVLENDSPDPLRGKWIDRGRVNTTHAGIDGTVFVHHGAIYFAYSPYIGARSGIAVARLANPWTIAGKESVIAVADKTWETQGGRSIMEGPEFLEGPDGRVFMTYSAGACWSDNYALGLMEAKRGGDLLSPKSWTKSPVPVLSSANGVYATGHNGFFRSPDGHEQWIIYHANPAAGMGCTPKRAPYISKVSWNDGAPVFAPPAPAGTRLRKPAGTGHGNINASRRPMP
ncbi:MAG: glycoside hydrolase family 43 protein [Sphingomonas sp.]